MNYTEMPDNPAWDRPVAALSEDGDLDRLLDDVFDRLRVKKAEFSMRQLRRLEGELDEIERDLDAFIARQGT
jgi:hypothetical protein